jgi:hypothetical protein
MVSSMLGNQAAMLNTTIEQAIAPITQVHCDLVVDHPANNDYG